MDIGIVRKVDIDAEMRGAYLDYAMSVIVSRALPDVRDGLKPVHRRILYAMHDMGLRSDRPYKKSARIVGEVLGKYHPHGDAAVYDAMARMAQDFSMRYVLVDGQGNFGSIDGDSPAAMRYTEARLSPMAEEMLADIDKETVDFVDNFDGSLKEPSVLPSRIPNLLLNGASGIAVGMATNIPPHNLGELCDAITFVIEQYARLDEITVDELMAHLPGPDFPTGGIILGTEGIRAAYAKGTGRITVRAKTVIEEMRGGRFRIQVTELPYQVNKSSLLERIADLVRSGRIDGIADLRDESDRSGMSIVIELKRGASPRTVLNQLLKFTPMQSTYGINMLALVDGEPRVLSLKRAIALYIEHRRDVITRRCRYDLDKARARAHVLEGLRIALDFLDEVIRTIRQSPDADTAQAELVRRFKLTEIQARAILDMQLRRLAALERQKIEDEYAEVRRTIAYLEDILANPQKILTLIRQDLADIKAKYGDARRTHISAEEAAELSDEDLVAREDVLITITQRGYVKRVPLKAYRAQARGGRGVAGITTREEDAVQFILAATTMDYILFFTNRGRAFGLRAHQIPDASRQAKGVHMANLLALDEGESATAAVAVPDFQQAEYLVMATRNGKVKRTPLAEFAAVRPSGIIALNLEEGDALHWVRLTRGGQEIILVTEGGQGIRFSEESVRPMGRSAGGVMGIRLAKGDHVTSMTIAEPGGDLLIVTTRGYGKRIPLEDIPLQGRNGRGVRVQARNQKVTGPVTSARVVQPDDEITVVSTEGMVLRTPVQSIPRAGRAARGARVIDIRGDDEVAAVARLESDRATPPNGAAESEGNGDATAAGHPDP
ncbi:MAG: DNA gyrase subunit A [Chloroflexi bacterium]|nr:DNA gyrase subunit A [Chloroflexota bacterium]